MIPLSYNFYVPINHIYAYFKHTGFAWNTISKVEISCKLLSNHQWNQVSLKDKLTCVTANKNLCDMAQLK